MNVCENTRGWPSTAWRGVLAGLAEGPLPWVTMPDTVTSKFGGWLPVPLRELESD